MIHLHFLTSLFKLHRASKFSNSDHIVAFLAQYLTIFSNIFFHQFLSPLPLRAFCPLNKCTYNIMNVFPLFVHSLTEKLLSSNLDTRLYSIDCYRGFYYHKTFLDHYLDYNSEQARKSKHTRVDKMNVYE